MNCIDSHTPLPLFPSTVPLSNSIAYSTPGNQWTFQPTESEGSILDACRLAQHS